MELLTCEALPLCTNNFRNSSQLALYRIQNEQIIISSAEFVYLSAITAIILSTMPCHVQHKHSKQKINFTPLWKHLNHLLLAIPTTFPHTLDQILTRYKMFPILITILPLLHDGLPKLTTYTWIICRFEFLLVSVLHIPVKNTSNKWGD